MFQTRSDSEIYQDVMIQVHNLAIKKIVPEYIIVSPILFQIWKDEIKKKYPSHCADMDRKGYYYAGLRVLTDEKLKPFRIKVK